MYYIHHSKRTIYTEQVVQDADLYNHVISGPSELGTQAGNTDKLAGTESFDTYPPGSPARHGGAAVVADGSLVMEVVELLRDPHGGAAAHRIPRGVGMARPTHGPGGRSAVSNRSHARQILLFDPPPNIRAPETHGSGNVHRSFT